MLFLFPVLVALSVLPTVPVALSLGGCTGSGGRSHSPGDLVPPVYAVLLLTVMPRQGLSLGTRMVAAVTQVTGLAVRRGVSWSHSPGASRSSSCALDVWRACRARSGWAPRARIHTLYLHYGKGCRIKVHFPGAFPVWLKWQSDALL